MVLVRKKGTEYGIHLMEIEKLILVYFTAPNSPAASPHDGFLRIGDRVVAIGDSEKMENKRLVEGMPLAQVIDFIDSHQSQVALRVEFHEEAYRFLHQQFGRSLDDAPGDQDVVTSFRSTLSLQYPPRPPHHRSAAAKIIHGFSKRCSRAVRAFGALISSYEAAANASSSRTMRRSRTFSKFSCGSKRQKQMTQSTSPGGSLKEEETVCEYDDPRFTLSLDRKKSKESIERQNGASNLLVLRSTAFPPPAPFRTSTPSSPPAGRPPPALSPVCVLKENPRDESGPFSISVHLNSLENKAALAMTPTRPQTKVRTEDRTSTAPFEPEPERESNVSAQRVQSGDCSGATVTRSASKTNRRGLDETDSSSTLPPASSHPSSSQRSSARDSSHKSFSSGYRLPSTTEYTGLSSGSGRESVQTQSSGRSSKLEISIPSVKSVKEEKPMSEATDMSAVQSYCNVLLCSPSVAMPSSCSGQRNN